MGVGRVKSKLAMRVCFGSGLTRSTHAYVCKTASDSDLVALASAAAPVFAAQGDEKMAIVTLASALARWINPAQSPVGKPLVFPAVSLDELFRVLFEHSPRLRGYVVDEHGRVRHHVTLFVDGHVIDKSDLNQPLAADSEVYIMQALSGG